MRTSFPSLVVRQGYGDIMRVDLGFGNDGNSGIYFGIEKAF